MPLALFDGVSLVAEIALTTAAGKNGIWDAAMWDVDLWGFSENWEDVSGYVRTWETHAAFSRDLRVWSAGTAKLVLNNIDGRFSPDNLTGPYAAAGVSGIRPGCAMRISLTYLGVTYPLFKGWVTTWDESWELHGNRSGDALMTVNGVDEWSRISKAKGVAVAPLGAGDPFGTRIGRLLDAASSTAPRQLDTGSTTMQATDMSSDPVAEIGVTADSEGGSVYIGPDGTVIAKRKYALNEDTRSVNVQVTFGDGPGETLWTALDKAPLDDAMIINIAALTRVGGTQQRYFDPTSRALNGDRNDPGTNGNQLVCETDAQVLSLAQWIVALNKDPEARINAITINPRCDLVACGIPAAVPVALRTQLMDLVEVKVRPPSATNHTMTRSCFVSGVSHQGGRADWITTYNLSSATVYRAFSTSLWDVGLWGVSDTDPLAARWVP